MERDRVLEILREHKDELQAAGLLHLRLFGSVARGDSTPASDVDLLADFNADAFSLFDFVRLEAKLTHLLAAEVHLTSTLALKRSIHAGILMDAVHAF